MRSRKLDRAIDLQSDRVRILAVVTEPIGWFIAFTGTIAGVLISVNAPEGDPKANALVVFEGIAFIVVTCGVGFGLALLGRLGVLQALMAESTLISTRPAKAKAEREDVTHFGASVFATSNGLKVVGVDRDGPANYAGLKVDDVIVDVVGLESLTVEDFVRFVQAAPADTVLALTVIRRGEEQSVEITLD